MEVLLGLSIFCNMGVIGLVLFHQRRRDDNERVERQELYNRIASPGLVVQDLEGELVQPSFDNDVAYHELHNEEEAAQQAREQAAQALSALGETG